MSLEIIFAIAGLMALTLILLMSMFARCTARPGPMRLSWCMVSRYTNYQRARLGDFPDGRELQTALARADVFRRRAPARSLYKTRVAVTVEAVAQIGNPAPADQYRFDSFSDEDSQEREGIDPPGAEGTCATASTVTATLVLYRDLAGRDVEDISSARAVCNSLPSGKSPSLAL